MWEVGWGCQQLIRKFAHVPRFRKVFQFRPCFRKTLIFTPPFFFFHPSSDVFLCSVFCQSVFSSSVPWYVKKKFQIFNLAQSCDGSGGKKKFQFLKPKKIYQGRQAFQKNLPNIHAFAILTDQWHRKQWLIQNLVMEGGRGTKEFF